MYRCAKPYIKLKTTIGTVLVPHVLQHRRQLVEFSDAVAAFVRLVGHIRAVTVAEHALVAEQARRILLRVLVELPARVVLATAAAAEPRLNMRYGAGDGPEPRLPADRATHCACTVNLAVHLELVCIWEIPEACRADVPHAVFAPCLGALSPLIIRKVGLCTPVVALPARTAPRPNPPVR